MKSPYLTPSTPSSIYPSAESSLCSLGACDQMWPYYKFNKDTEMILCFCPFLERTFRFIEFFAINN